MTILNTLKRPPWRTVIPGCLLVLAIWSGYHLWQPGLDIIDGRDDQGRNAIWLSHGWFGDDRWFKENRKTNEIAQYRNSEQIRQLAGRLRANHITDVFPHLCPALPNGKLPGSDDAQVERFLDAFEGFRVIPWIGGPVGANVRLSIPAWRAAFTTNVQQLLATHPRLAGVQLNIEPLTSGDQNFLALLDQLHQALPPGKILSIAAYPPPTIWQRDSDIHWNQDYYHEIARRSDQLAVMMYDVGLRKPKTYQYLMSSWTKEILNWSVNTPLLLGIPTYNDAGVDYHNPTVENITNALLGIHRGLLQVPHANYQGIAIYCDWETTPTDWAYFHDHFLKNNDPIGFNEIRENSR